MGLVAFELAWLYFNPRTHVGYDTDNSNFRNSDNDFNPRTHAGCDWLKSPVRLQERVYFNPRTHAGCDHRYL